MIPGDTAKWIYTFLLLVSTIGWAVFVTVIVRDAIANPTTAGVLEAAGTSVLLGALIAWNGNVNQHWFRKKTPT